MSAFVWRETNMQCVRALLCECECACVCMCVHALWIGVRSLGYPSLAWIYFPTFAPIFRKAFREKIRLTQRQQQQQQKQQDDGACICMRAHFLLRAIFEYTNTHTHSLQLVWWLSLLSCILILCSIRYGTSERKKRCTVFMHHSVDCFHLMVKHTDESSSNTNPRSLDCSFSHKHKPDPYK